MEEANALTIDEFQGEPKDSWEVMFRQVELVRELGRGAFGKVWKGVLTTNEIVKIDDNKKKKKLAKKVNRKVPNKKEKTTKTMQKKTKVAVKMLRGEYVM